MKAICSANPEPGLLHPEKTSFRSSVLERQPKISVIMPVYKVEHYVAHSIQSVLDQTFDNWELLVVDDASPDASASVIARFTDPRIRYIRHETNLGVSEARNTGIRHARGEYLALLDSDDIALPERLAAQIRYLERHPKIGLVGTWAELIDENGNKTGLRNNPYPDELLRSMLLFRNTFNTSSLMLRKCSLPNGLFKNMLGEDYDFVSVLAEIWDVACLPSYLIQYRINSQGLTGTRWPQMKADCWTTQQRLLARLGLDATADEAALHQRISHATADGISAGEAEVACHWVAKILQANETTSIYPPAQLRHACEEILFSLWRQAASEGIVTVFKARNALAPLGIRPGLGQMARMARRALRPAG